jgi:hypothetical protein
MGERRGVAKGKGKIEDNERQEEATKTELRRVRGLIWAEED